MNVRTRGVCVLVVCFGGSIQFAAQGPRLFSEYPRTPNADPGTRHRVEVSIPTRLIVRRAADHISISYDLASLRKLKITVGQEMTIGLKDELRVYPKGDARPSRYRSILEGGVEGKEANAALLANANLLKSTQTVTRLQDGMPTAGKRYIIEHDIILFETDVPAQHMWRPESSPKYRILWKKKLNALR